LTLPSNRFPRESDLDITQQVTSIGLVSDRRDGALPCRWEELPLSSQRNEFIHMVRGGAAISVAAFHIYGQSREPGWGIETVRWVSEWGYLGVHVFFVISGFVIANSLRNDYITPKYAGNYALRRSLRLDPPYWCAILFALALTFAINVVQHLPTEWPTWQVVLAHAVYAQNILCLGNLSIGLWTLCLEVQFYVTMLLLVALSQRTKVPLLVFVLIGGLASLFCSAAIDADSNIVWSNAYRSLLPNFAMFAIGILAWMVTTDRISRTTWLITQLLVAARLVVWFQPELLVAAVAGGAIVLQANGRLRVPTIPALMFLGTVSYSLYLLHVPAARIVILGFNRIFDLDGYASLAICTLGIAASVFAAAILYWLVERPSMTLADRIKPTRSEKPSSAVEPAPQEPLKVLTDTSV